MSRRPKRGREPVFDNPSGAVLVRTVFERFPVTVKGAFVLRGGDPDPHVARILQAWIARTPAGPVKPITAPATAMNVAPHLDLYLPFEASIAELDPAWYVVRSELQVDGARAEPIDSRPFCVPWPRGSMATGSATLGERVTASGRPVVVERVDLRTDRVEVLWRGDGWEDEEPAFRLSADGVGLERLPGAAGSGEPAPGKRRAVWYPAPRGTRALSLHAGARSRLDVPLS